MWQVGAGFMPAFKFKQKIGLVIERGRKARAYDVPLCLLRTELRTLGSENLVFRRAQISANTVLVDKVHNKFIT